MSPAQWIARGLLTLAVWYIGMMFNNSDGHKQLAYSIVVLAALSGMIYVSLLIYA